MTVYAVLKFLWPLDIFISLIHSVIYQRVDCSYWSGCTEYGNTILGTPRQAHCLKFDKKKNDQKIKYDDEALKPPFPVIIYPPDGRCAYKVLPPHCFRLPGLMLNSRYSLWFSVQVLLMCGFPSDPLVSFIIWKTCWLVTWFICTPRCEWVCMSVPSRLHSNIVLTSYLQCIYIII